MGCVRGSEGSRWGVYVGVRGVDGVCTMGVRGVDGVCTCE